MQTPEKTTLLQTLDAVAKHVDPALMAFLRLRLDAYLETCIEPTGRLYRHKKRGSSYREMRGEVQLNSARRASVVIDLDFEDRPAGAAGVNGEGRYDIAYDGEMCRLYVDSTSGQLFVRPIPEFEDGRFEETSVSHGNPVGPPENGREPVESSSRAGERVSAAPARAVQPSASKSSPKKFSKKGVGELVTMQRVLLDLVLRITEVVREERLSPEKKQEISYYLNMLVDRLERVED